MWFWLPLNDFQFIIVHLFQDPKCGLMCYKHTLGQGCCSSQETVPYDCIIIHSCYNHMSTIVARFSASRSSSYYPIQKMLRYAKCELKSHIK